MNISIATRKLSFFAVLLLIVTVSACKKKDTRPTSFEYPYDGTASGYLNGEPWTPKVTAGYFSRGEPTSYYIRLATFDGDKQMQHYFAIGPIPFTKTIADTLSQYNSDYMEGIEPLRIMGLYVRFLANDLGSPDWTLDLSLPHRINLSYDPATQLVSGDLEARYSIPFDTVASPWAKPVHFTNLHFKAKVHKYIVPELE